MKSIAFLFAALLSVSTLQGAVTSDDPRTQAEAGNSTAQISLGAKYEQGDGVPKDFTTAMSGTAKRLIKGMPRPNTPLP